MPRLHIINALDIGTSSIKLISVLKKGDDKFEILASAQEPSFGIRKGIVVEVPKVSETISSLVKKIEKETNKKIDGVYASMGGSHIFSTASHGLVSVSRADQKISQEDIERVHQVAQTPPLPSNNEILEVFPKEYFVDGQGGIKDAIGMNGVRLETNVTILAGFTPYVKNSKKSIAEAGLYENYIMPDFLASSKAVLTSKEKELGVCLLDIGAGTTGVCVYEEGSLVHSLCLPLGSGHITNDIAVCLKTDIDIAEKIKIEYGKCKPRSKDKKESISGKKIRVESEEPVLFSEKELTAIIEARISEIFDLVYKELKRISKNKLPAGVVLTGGGSKISGITDLAKKKLKLSCRLGKPNVISTYNDPSLATLCGIVLEASEMEEEPKRKPGLLGWIIGLFRKFINIFSP